MSKQCIAAVPGGLPLPEPWEFERQEPLFDGDDIVLRDDGVGLLLPLPGEAHPSVTMRFEVLGQKPFSFLALIGSVNFSCGWMQNPGNTISRQSHVIAEAGGPVGEVDRWYLVELEAGGGHACMRIDGEVFMEGEDPEGPVGFHQISTKHWGEQRLRNLVVKYEAPVPPTRSRSERFDLHMVVDFADDIHHGRSFTRATFESLFDTLKSWGVSRTYWHYFLIANDWPSRHTLFGETLDNVGDFLKLVIDLAHERDMELYATLKPFDILWSARTDQPFHCKLLDFAEEASRPVEVTGRVGGERVVLPGWLAGHEEALVQRCPVAMPEGAIAEIELVRENDEPAGFDTSQIELWVSNDNRTYTRYDSEMSIVAERQARPKLQHTPRGPVETNETETVTVIRMTGLNVREPYFAVRTPESPAALEFCNQYFALVQAWTSGEDRVPLTLGLYSGPKFDRRKADLREVGAAFDWGATSTQGIWGQPDFVETRGPLSGPSGFLAFARGKNRYLDMLSAAHPLSHKLWLEVVARCIGLGVDGMDLRIRCHKSSVEWSAFGFEPGVVEAFRERYGVDIRYEDFDAEAWRRLRGEQYTEFVRAASEMLHDAGRKLQHHVSPGMVPPPSQPTILHVHFDWERWLAERLIDSITCKQLEHHTAFFTRVRDTAHGHGALMYDCPYINTYFHGQASAWATRLRKNIRLARACGLDGYMVYENAAVLRAEGDAVHETREGIGRLLREQMSR